jgi:hypothetical protein
METPPDNNPKTVYGMRKPSMACVPPVALLHLSKAMMNGRDKYGLMNWRENYISASIYYDAAMRHLISWYDGETMDPESGVHHLGHVMACCAILLDGELLGKLNDNRQSTSGTFPALCREMAKEKEHGESDTSKGS